MARVNLFDKNTTYYVGTILVKVTDIRKLEKDFIVNYVKLV